MKKNSLRDTLKSLLLLALGSFLCALVVNGILVPKRFLSGGLTGVAILLHHFFPAAHVSWIYLAFNVPLSSSATG